MTVGTLLLPIHKAASAPPASVKTTNCSVVAANCRLKGLGHGSHSTIASAASAVVNRATRPTRVHITDFCFGLMP